MTKKQRRIEWRTLNLILATYGAWFMAGMLLWPAFPVAALVVMSVLCALHSSLVHEVIHGHPTRSAALNEALVFVNPAMIWPFKRYRTMHLRHHADERLTDPFDDPESYYRALWCYEDFPKWLRSALGWSNTLLGRLLLGPILSTIALITKDFTAIAKGDETVRKAWLLHVLGIIPVVLIVVFLFGIPLWLYFLTVVWGSAAIISLRTFAEHQWHETPEGRTIIVERSPLSLLFLNNNLHLVHHQNPSAPWYDLPTLYRAKRDYWRALNGGYVYPNYWQLVRAYALIAKEPVTHPAWRRSKETE